MRGGSKTVDCRGKGLTRRPRRPIFPSASRAFALSPSLPGRHAVKWILAAVLCAGGASLCAADEKQEVRNYTNDDLDRVRPRRDETGVNSSPAPTGLRPAVAGAPAPGRGVKGAQSSEAYWRKEAERQRVRMDVFRREAAALEQKLAERQRKPGVRPYSDPEIERYRASLSELHARAREVEARFLDRARREGALPGWLR